MLIVVINKGAVLLAERCSHGGVPSFYHGWVLL